MNNLLDYMVYQNDYSMSKNLTSDYIKKSDEDKEIINLFIDFYQGMNLISIQESPPNLQKVQNTSNVIIGGFDD